MWGCAGNAMRQRGKLGQAGNKPESCCLKGGVWWETLTLKNKSGDEGRASFSQQSLSVWCQMHLCPTVVVVCSPSVRDRVRTKMERDILVEVNHPFIVKLHYGGSIPVLCPCCSALPHLWRAHIGF